VPDPNSPEEWLRLAKHHELAANRLSLDKKLGTQVLFHVGSAVETALKAYIMRAERLNSWPSKEARPELYTHDLRQLVKISGIILTPDIKLAASWHVVLQWDRSQAYDPKPMPRRVSASWIEAAFGQNGVVTWIRTICR
jgi:hypothetical protein